jgi:hypothetical protein
VVFVNVLQSDVFSWGPVEQDGEFKLEFNNWFDSSSVNSVNLEFKIVSSTNYLLPTTLVLVIVAVLVDVAIPAAIVLRPRAGKNKSTLAKAETENTFKLKSKPDL